MFAVCLVWLKYVFLVGAGARPSVPPVGTYGYSDLSKAESERRVGRCPTIGNLDRRFIGENKMNKQNRRRRAAVLIALLVGVAAAKPADAGPSNWLGGTAIRLGFEAGGYTCPARPWYLRFIPSAVWYSLSCARTAE